MSSNELLNKESSKVGSKGYFQGKEKKIPLEIQSNIKRETQQKHTMLTCVKVLTSSQT